MINCIAIEYHSNNFIHGDIKPQNIFFGDNEGNYYTISDVGSLLYVGEEKESKGSLF